MQRADKTITFKIKIKGWVQKFKLLMRFWRFGSLLSVTNDDWKIEKRNSELTNNNFFLYPDLNSKILFRACKTIYFCQ